MNCSCDERNEHRCVHKNESDVVKDIRKGLKNIHEGLTDFEKKRICKGIWDIKKGIKDTKKGLSDIIITLNEIFK